MPQFSMNAADLGRTRFAYSPLAEVVESLWMALPGRIRPPYRGWYDAIHGRLGGIDRKLLAAVIPARPVMADFLLVGVESLETSIDQQLESVQNLPGETIAHDLLRVWDESPPTIVHDLVQDPDGPKRIADALWKYWTLAIEPYWRWIRAVLDGDVAHRASGLTRGGIEPLLDSLHPKISFHDEVLQVGEPTPALAPSGRGLLLVPCTFAWPYALFAEGRSHPPSLIYPARGVGDLWDTPQFITEDEDPLGSMLGRSRAGILRALAVPHSTSELAGSLGQSPPAVSQHLSVLRRNGMVTSWRSGRRVIYQRTALGCRVAAADSQTRSEAGSGGV